MPRPNRVTRAILKSVARSERRSTLFWWLFEHHDSILAAAKGERIDWAAVCRTAVENGLTDTRGQPPTLRNARETWAQARKAVARERAMLAAAPPKRLMPSRLPKDWRPEIVETRNASPAASGSRAGVPSAPQTLAPFESGRKYEMPPIADEDLDLSEIPETFVDDDGQIKPRPLEARRTLARIKAELRWDGARLSRIMNG